MRDHQVMISHTFPSTDIDSRKGSSIQFCDQIFEAQNCTEMALSLATLTCNPSLPTIYSTLLTYDMPGDSKTQTCTSTSSMYETSHVDVQYPVLGSSKKYYLVHPLSTSPTVFNHPFDLNVHSQPETCPYNHDRVKTL